MTTLPQPPLTNRPLSALGSAVRICVITVIVFAVAAALVAWIALKPGLLLIGSLVAFFMMLMIGMPLLLASIADATESASH